MASILGLHRSVSRGSDRELAYASPKMTELTRDGADGRKRRSRGSSDDDGSPTSDGFIDEDLRVGGPYLCSLPLRTIEIPPSDPLQRLLETDRSVITEAFRIANIHNLQYKKFVFVRRQSVFNPEATPIPTFLFKAKREKVDGNWLTVAREIRTYLESQNLGEVSIEIADPDAFKSPNMSLVLITDPIFGKWNFVLNELLRQMDLQGVKAVGCFRRGRNLEQRDDPPTILVTVDPKSTKSWKANRELIVQILGRHSLSMVAVEIVKGEIYRNLGRRGLDESLLKGHGMLGESIAPHSLTTASGSLGGFVKIQNPNGLWRKFALTCFHCVFPESDDALGSQHTQGQYFFRICDGYRTPSLARRALRAIWPKSMLTYCTELKRWRENGVSPGNEENTILRVDHPSRNAMAEEIESIQRKINAIKTPDIWHVGQRRSAEGTFKMMPKVDQEAYKSRKLQVEQYQRFLEKLRKFGDTGKFAFGHVWAGSGFKLKKATLSNTDSQMETVLDWALVNFPADREGLNKLKNGCVLRDLLPPRTKLTHGEPLSTQGYRTVPSLEGHYNCLKVAQVHEVRDENGTVVDEITTFEHSVVSDWFIGGEPAENFSQKGDSGSFIYSIGDYRVVGMLWGGSDRVTYFTHIGDLVADIKQVTGARDVRLSPR